MTRPTVHTVRAAILESARRQVATYDDAARRGDLPLASDDLLVRIANNASQGLADLLQPPRAADLDEDRCDFGDPQCGRAATHAASGDELDDVRRLCETHARYVEEVYGASIERVIPVWEGEMRERTPRRLRWHLERGDIRARVIATLRPGGGGIEDVIVAFYRATQDLDGPEPAYAHPYSIAEAARFAAALFDHVGDKYEDHRRDRREVTAAVEIDVFQVPAGRVDVSGPDALLLVAAYFVDHDCDSGIDLVESSRRDLLGRAVRAWSCPSSVPGCTEDVCRHVAPPDHAPIGDRS